MRVAIVGAGLAGLIAAYQLSASDPDIQITIYEADNRVGGRVYTLRDFSSGMYAEAGAMSFTDADIDLMDLIKQLGLDTVELCHKYHKKYHDPVLGNIPYAGSLPAKLFKKYILNNMPVTINDLHAPENIAYDHMSMLNFINMLVEEYNEDSFDTVMNAIKVSLLGMYCDDLSKISALNALRWINQYTQSSKIYAIKGGNDLLTQALQDAILQRGVIIHLAHQVINVARPEVQGESPVILTMINQGGEQIIEFDYVVMAVPLSALQHTISFEPPLPGDYQAVIKSIPYNNSIARVYYEYEHRFWRKQADVTAMTIQHKPTVWIEDHTSHCQGDAAILEVHASSEMGQQLQTDDEVFFSAENELIDIWGEETIKANSCKQAPQLFLWSKVMHQHGAYPYLGVGQSMFPLIWSGSLPGLSFAGEYTSIFNAASMTGAIQSAYRVSREVSAVYSSRLVAQAINGW